MTFQRVSTRIPADAPGMSTELTYFRIGPDTAETKIYLQAALHADEQPGLMVLHHLLPMLERADAEGALRARFVVFPMVNPLGMAQLTFQTHSGRYDARSGTNFNRQWPDLYTAVGETVASRLGPDPEANTALVRAAVGDWLGRQAPVTAMQRLRHLIMTEAHDADYVLDLHCDNEALPHIFITPDSMAGMQDLADRMGSVAQLTAEDSGGGSFDEVWPSLWTRLRAAHPQTPIPMGARAATLEYRGQSDVSDDLNRRDAENLYHFFQGRGLVAGTPPPVPMPMPEPTPLAATEIVRVERAGLLAYRVQLGDWVEKGEAIADVIALDGPQAFTARAPILATTSGRVISRNRSKYVWPGAAIAKIVGTEPLPERKGYLLED